MRAVELDVAGFYDSDEVEAMARKAGGVKRRSPLTGMRFLLTFTMGRLNTPDGTLAQLAAFLGATCGATVSPQAVDERINAMAREFVGLCLRRALEIAAAIPRAAGDVLDWFTHVYVIDSTNFELRPALAPHFKGNGGGASPAAMRIQFAFDYRTGTMHVEIGDVRMSDTDTFARLVGKRLPDDVVNRRIRKANEASQSKSRQISDLYRLFLHYARFVTSLPLEFGMVQLFALYRIRWQVELAFKVWKSILAIHRIRSAKENRVLCEVYGKLIVAVLTSCLCAAARAFLDGLAVSPHKVARHVRAVATNWALAIMAGTARHCAFIKVLSRLLARFRRKTRQKRKPTIEEILTPALPSVSTPLAQQPVTP